MTKADHIINYNGEDIPVKDVPDPLTRHMLGYGHHNPYNRPVVAVEGRTYPFTPDTCELADEPNHTEWIKDGTILICIGCGIDGT
jgi:hypothetical protein